MHTKDTVPGVVSSSHTHAETLSHEQARSTRESGREECGMPSEQVRAPGRVAVTVRYWAGARAAAGTEQDHLSGGTVGEVVTAATTLHPALAPVAAVSTLLLDGRAVTRDAALVDGSVLEVLPPFAGG